MKNYQEMLDSGMMDMLLDVQLKTVDDIKEFVRISEEIPSPVILRSNTYVIDGKSIFGVLSLCWEKPVKLEISAKYANKFDKWRV